jgi:hypothetical protein
MLAGAFDEGGWLHATFLELLGDRLGNLGLARDLAKLDGRRLRQVSGVIPFLFIARMVRGSANTGGVV